SAKEAVTLAQMSREIFETDWVKLEVIGDDYNLQPDPFETLVAAEQLLKLERIRLQVVVIADHFQQPDPFETLVAAEQLLKLGFKVFPYCTDDLVFCLRLRDLG